MKTAWRAATTSPTTTRTKSRNRRPRRGFTLIEVLLVVVIILIGTAVSLPTFARAMRGANLRASVRSMVALHRYARATSVIKQRAFAIYLYQEQGKLELVSLVPESSLAVDPASAGDDPAAVPAADPFNSTAGMPVTYTVELEEARLLGKDVVIAEVELENEDQTDREVSWVNYYPNGMCDACVITFEDAQGNQAVLTLDALSGRVEVVYE